ncbi:hypothetical protein KDL01_01520 [Actinospica durhamensis]|uniref:Uncharacterized protein n=1 Tax=Actinospica durhamensis TaxID=1508375 RepID=A0A941EKB1_9ACTN|nr:hypothetical protein [Actinospica durhamensis]MBR7831918.1 hypothetical protein [Actinospica durhamensis]
MPEGALIMGWIQPPPGREAVSEKSNSPSGRSDTSTSFTVLSAVPLRPVRVRQSGR